MLSSLASRPALSRAWVQHLPDYYGQCGGRQLSDLTEIRAEADCPCGITERHIHCGGCGRVLSIGDWDAPPIAVYRLDLRRRKVRKVR